MQPSSPNSIGGARGLGRLLHRLAPRATAAENREMLRGLLVLGGTLFALTGLTYLWTTQWNAPFPRDRTTLVLGRDFLNLWMYGRDAFGTDFTHFYDLVQYNDTLTALLGAGYPGQNRPNPPTALIVMAPFGLLGYFQALICWFAISVVAFGLACRAAFPDARALIIVALSPAALMCILSGQSSFLTTAALFAIFAWLDRRPTLSGVLIALLTIKPQLGILFPVMLIASGRWRVFFSAALATLVLFAASVALAGLESWHDYLTMSLPQIGEILRDTSGIATPFQCSIFMNFRGVFGDDIAQIVQFVATVAAIAGVAFAYRFRAAGDPAQLRALFLACTACASPYMGDYDLLPLTCAAVALLANETLDGTGRRLVQLVFWSPALQLLFGNLQLPGPGLIAPAFAAYLLRELLLFPAGRVARETGVLTTA